ncbi:HD domain-containing phosphohydrolase [Clostridium lacusfryxellense]|uniref:HD domain-containing phosphohydrolase n=1 Tax=Clostridium lacusfryxellense TaxID=205328 RepID=UPI001C0C0CFD|nr:HD domain-containing phosphohydrolase [Clostridium lacusfryxellense]MBU3112903.1 diguanylate cyclase [Clostridium lacusfryxellense]
MNDNFYKKLIEASPTGYAYHKIICDEDGIPCDYEFIEVNDAFEKLTGLNKFDIVGRKVSSVLPEIVKSNINLVRLYGDVAINGGEKEIEQYYEFLQRWYKIIVHSPEKYYFATYLIDITKQMNQLSDMERLIEISEEFLQINDHKINYQKISDDFLNICGAKYAAFNLFDEGGKSFTTISISGDRGMIKKISLLLGFKIEGKKWDADTLIGEKIKNSTISRFNSFRELVGKVIPAPLVVLIEKTFNLGEIILITILRNNIMLGHFTLIMKKGETFNKDTLAEVYSRQLGMVISRRRAEDELLNERILTDAIFQSAPGMIYLYDDQSRLVRWNKKHEDLTGYSSEELSKINIMDWFKGDEESQKAVIEGITKAATEGYGDAEANLQRKDGTTVALHLTASALYLDGKQYLAGVGIDITDNKKKNEEIYYLSYHDQLTGLYNRRFYEEELNRLDTIQNYPLTIVMGDVNGLKLINDSFGHVMGDNLLKKVAEVIIVGCRVNDIVARLGGDEFVIILPKTDDFEAEQIIKRITKLSLSEKVGFVDISISFGYKTKKNEKEKNEDILKDAEDNMYKKKLFEGPSMRGKTIKAIINTLHEKDQGEEEHSNRVSELCKTMGEVLGMNGYEKEELKSAGLLHDIGKIAIDEKLLNKVGKLTDYEWEEIKRHPEIGYRILNTVNDMTDIAMCVLSHHERWDGTGYPKGLKGNEIPVTSRIIAIADAYDFMTSVRSYKIAIPKKSAIDELQNNSGSQFDPEMVKVFIENVLVKEDEGCF